MNEQEKMNPLSLLALVVLTLVWGYSWIVMKSVLKYIDALDFTAIRTVLAGLLLLVLLCCTGRSVKPPPFLPTLLIGLFQTVAMAIFSQLALMYGGAGKVAIMVYTMPFWLMGLSVLFLHEHLHRQQIISMVLAVFGLILIIQPWSLTGSTISYILALLSGISWAISVIIAKKMYQRYSVEILSLTTWQMLYGSPFLIIIALFFNANRYLDPTPYFWFALSYNVILAVAVAWLLWLYILKNMPANLAGLSTLAIPVIGALLSWWLLKEQPNHSELLGMCLIALALACLNLRHIKRRATT